MVFRISRLCVTVVHYVENIAAVIWRNKRNNNKQKMND